MLKNIGILVYGVHIAQCTEHIAQCMAQSAQCAEQITQYF